MVLFIVHITFLAALLITAAFAASKFKNAMSDYRPMLLFFIATFLLETLLFVFANNTAFVRILVNIQVILGFFLVCWQAYKLHVFKKLSNMQLLIGWMISAWLVELIYRKFDTGDIPWFSVVYNFIIVILAIEIFKRQVSVVDQRLLQNPVALFSLGLIFYYTFIILLDLFMLFSVNPAQNVLAVIYTLYITLGLVTNFLYLRAVLCLRNIIG